MGDIKATEMAIETELEAIREIKKASEKSNEYSRKDAIRMDR
jgi:hypothetical protein